MINTAQRSTIDREVAAFATRANCGIAQVQVTTVQAHDSENVFLSLYFGGHRADHSDWSFYGSQLTPAGVEPSWFADERDRLVRDALDEPAVVEALAGRQLHPASSVYDLTVRELLEDWS